MIDKQEIIGGELISRWIFRAGTNPRKVEKLKKKIYKSCRNQEKISKNAIRKLLRMRLSEPAEKDLLPSLTVPTCYSGYGDVGGSPNDEEIQIIRSDLSREHWHLAKTLMMDPDEHHQALAEMLFDDVSPKVPSSLVS